MLKPGRRLTVAEATVPASNDRGEQLAVKASATLAVVTAAWSLPTDAEGQSV